MHKGALNLTKEKNTHYICDPVENGIVQASSKDNRRFSTIIFNVQNFK